MTVQLGRPCCGTGERGGVGEFEGVGYCVNAELSVVASDNEVAAPEWRGSGWAVGHVCEDARVGRVEVSGESGGWGGGEGKGWIESFGSWSCETEMHRGIEGV